MRLSELSCLGSIKADSHIACRAHAAPKPFPCHTVPLRVKKCLSHLIYTVRPFLIHTCHAAHMPSPTMPFFSRPRHSMAVERACGLTASVQVLPAITRSSTKLLSDAYQSQMQVASVKQNTVYHEWGKRVVAAHYKKDDLLHVGLAVRIFPVTMRTFTKDTALSEQGRGAAWHVWINAWYGNSMQCVNQPLTFRHHASCILLYRERFLYI